jgi:hypothetical protein
VRARSLLNFALFQLVWFAAVKGAASGAMWLGPAAVVGFLALHLALVPAGAERGRELGYVLAVGLVGSLADSILHVLGATAYPTSHEAWPFLVVPPWIVSLWLAFAMLPRFSLAWLAGRPALGFLLGALGGPLSYLAGTRLGAVGVGESALLTWGALAVEYALVTPLLLHFAPGARDPRRAPASGKRDATERVAPGSSHLRSAARADGERGE